MTPLLLLTACADSGVGMTNTLVNTILITAVLVLLLLTLVRKH